MKKIIIGLCLLLFSLGILSFFVYFSLNDGKLHLTVCDVGQGDAILIRTPNGSDILIDGGPDKSVLSCLSAHMPFWDRNIEAIILTHPDADHLTGIVSVLQRYDVSQLFTQPNAGSTDIYLLFQKELADKNLSAKFVEAGDSLKFDDKVEFKILSPASSKPDPLAKKGSLNIYSVIGRLSYGNFSALFTGDAPIVEEEKIASEAGKVDVLKVSHHGSKTGTSDNFLNSILPQIALISVGVNNRYHHPAEESLKFLNNHGVKIFRTDKNGEIDILSDGMNYSINPQRQ